MTLPRWVEAVSGLAGKLTAAPIKVSKRAYTAAGYVSASFASAVVSLWDEGLAAPLRELSQSKLQKIKSIDIADAAEAHNKALLVRKQAEDTEVARAEVLRSEAAINQATARAIDGETERKKLEEERKLAEERRKEAEARLRLALLNLKKKGGNLYNDDPQEGDGPGGSPLLPQ